MRSALSLVGTIGGGLLAAASLPWILNNLGALGPAAAAISVGVVLAGVGLGNALVVTLGRPLWMALQVGPARIVDAAAGAVMSLFAGLIAMWLVAATVASLPSPHWRRRCAPRRCCSRSSASLRHRPPTWRTRCANCWTRCICRKSFGLEGLPGNKVPKPPKNVSDAAVVASQSVLRVSGPTPACGQGSTGSGFVYTTDRIATNAHVVAGMSQVRVVASDGRSWGADVVYFNADLDLAVLFVPGLGVRPLEASRQVWDADPAIIAGYPGGGPLDLRSARIVTRTSESPVFSDNIYGKPTKPARSSSCVAGSSRHLAVRCSLATDGTPVSSSPVHSSTSEPGSR